MTSIILLTAALFLQTIVILKDQSIGDEDAAAYALQGRRIAEGKGLTSNVVGQHFKRYAGVEHPEDYWPPLQPCLIAASRMFFGDTLFADKFPNVIAFLLLIICIFFVSRKFFSDPVAFLAAVLCLVSTEMNLYAIGRRNDLGYVLLLFIGVYLWSGTGPANPCRFRNIVLAGIVSGLAFLQRPIALLMPAAFLIGTVVVSLLLRSDMGERRIRALRRSVVPVLLFLTLCGAVVSPYAIRNIRTFGSPLPDLPSIWGAVILNSYIQKPDNRSTDVLDGSIARWKEIRHVYGERPPAVMLPDTSADVIAGLCRHYGVRYLVMPPSEAPRLRALGESGPETARFIPLANVAGYEIFTYTQSPPVQKME